MLCREAEPLIALLACDELEGDERAAVEAHVAACEACRAAMERERGLLDLVTASREEPSADLLTQCRNGLNDALDEVAPKKSFWARVLEAARPSNWFTLHPGWGAAFCLVLGVAVGNIVPRWVNQPLQDQAATGPQSGAVVVVDDPERDLRNVRITGVDWLPGGDSSLPRVSLSVQRDDSQELTGTLDDPRVRRMLAYVMQNGQRFDPGLRLDAAELLKARGDDSEVREALCHAARQDNNPGVRLKAVEALVGLGENDKVRQTLVDALLRDENPGVRVEAINALRAFAEAAGPSRASDYPRLVEVLRDRMERDPNTYVRMQSAAAVRQLSARAAD